MMVEPKFPKFDPLANEAEFSVNVVVAFINE